MRTTLTIDNDLAAKLKKKSQLKQKSFKDAINEILNIGLNSAAKPIKKQRFKVISKHRGFRNGIDTEKLNRLNDDLLVDDFFRFIYPQKLSVIEE